MAEMRASPVKIPGLKTLADIVRMVEERGEMEILPFNPATLFPVSSTTLENLAYGNLPMAIPSQSNIPITKTGRKQEVAELAGLLPTIPAASRGVAQGANYLGDVLTQAVTRNPQATSMRALDEIARMSPVPQIAPKPPQMPMTPPKSDIGFYSQLEAATIPLQNKGTGDQYLAQIQKSAGVKPEEIQWTGLNEFLTGKPSVTKQEIQDYLQANRVDVQEVQLGQNNAYTEWGKRLAQAKDSQEAAKINMELTLPDLSPVNYYNLRDMWAGPAARGDQEALSKIRSLGLTPEQEANVLDYGRQVSLVSELKGSAPPNLNPKFSNYTLPGGENYREILLTLPEKKLPLDEFLESVGKKYGGDTPRSQWSTEDIATYVRLLKEDPSVPRGYRSGHFDQPNILAHMRVNDRVVDGKKTLFIEEIQSDWHQAGRKKGYRNASGLSSQQIADQQADIFRRFDAGQITREQRNAEIDALNEAKENLQAVPDAPFKTSWHELSLKRAIQEASEKGYDQIAFTTGKTQAERYDLSKQVNKIDVEAVEEVPNLYFVDVDVAGGKTLNLEVENGIVRNDEFAGKALEDVVGKEIAEKVMSVQQGKTQRLSGDDLRIGGEGMKGFYDNILPKSLEKLGKKFDAKVGKTEMDGVEVWQMDITPKMRESVTTKGQPLFAIPTVGAAALGASMYDQDPLEQFLNYQ